jgi:hypothetical protein
MYFYSLLICFSFTSVEWCLCLTRQNQRTEFAGPLITILLIGNKVYFSFWSRYNPFSLFLKLVDSNIVHHHRCRPHHHHHRQNSFFWAIAFLRRFCQSYLFLDMFFQFLSHIALTSLSIPSHLSYISSCSNNILTVLGLYNDKTFHVPIIKSIFSLPGCELDHLVFTPLEFATIFF